MRKLFSIFLVLFMLIVIMPTALAKGTRGVINAVTVNDVTIAPPIGGKVNTADAVLILKYAAGMITDF